MNAHDLTADAEARIQEHRTAQAQLRVVDATGQPLANASLRVTLTRHEFKLGCNGFRIRSIDDAELQAAYEERFAALLNYATLPFYWGGYETEKGQTRQAQIEQMADWCKEHGIATKGHPLTWHEVYPQWAGDMDDADVMARQQARVREIVSHFAGRVDTWDVVNEATVSHRFDNAVGRWIKDRGATACVADALHWAHEANPGATLLYNDFNVSDAFEQLVQGLLDAGAPVHTIGIQSHMHKGTWPLDKAWQACETYAAFGLPLHFTELTVLSGRLKGPEDNDWHKRRGDWLTTPEGEQAQLDYGSQVYTLLFSHPAVEAITWWDFSDAGAWPGAPAGLVRKDMTPKPLYDWLMGAFHSRWTTDETATTDADGRATPRCFFGHHEVAATLPSGAQVRGAFSLSRAGGREVEVAMG